MINEAIKKINDEMQQQPNSEVVEAIGHYIIDHCDSEEKAKKILDKDKSLKAVVDKIRKVVKEKAKKEAAGKSGWVEINFPRENAFEIVDKYFDFSSETSKKQTSSIDIDFESFI